MYSTPSFSRHLTNSSAAFIMCPCALVRLSAVASCADLDCESVSHAAGRLASLLHYVSVLHASVGIPTRDDISTRYLSDRYRNASRAQHVLASTTSSH